MVKIFGKQAVEEQKARDILQLQYRKGYLDGIAASAIALTTPGMTIRDLDEWKAALLDWRDGKLADCPEPVASEVDDEE